MNIFYLISVISSRFINVASVIILSYLLTPKTFGQYSLVTTNAMLINLIFTSWISGSIWRDVSKSDSENYKLHVDVAIKYAGLMGAGCLLIVPILFATLSIDDRYLAVTLALAPLIMLIDLILVVLNARHAARLYSILSVLRSLLSLGIAIMLIALGFGLWGALIGQLLGIVIALLLLRDIRKMFVGFHAAPLVWPQIWVKFKFGIISATALNFYMLANALCRNIVALQMGEAQAGYFSLAADMLFAPIALFAISLSLSNIPTLYSAQGDNIAAQNQQSSAFIMATLAVALPYALGGGLVAPQLAQLILDGPTAAAVSEIAGYGAVQGACFAFLSALATLALTREKTKLALRFSLFVIAAVAVAMAVASRFSTLSSYALAVTCALVLTSIGSMVLIRPLFGLTLPSSELIKIGGATIIMFGSMLFTARFGNGTATMVAAIVLGGAVYIAISLIFRSKVIARILHLRHI
jgi:O-antigen/teichoic acid export membrane protein